MRIHFRDAVAVILWPRLGWPIPVSLSLERPYLDLIAVLLLLPLFGMSRPQYFFRAIPCLQVRYADRMVHQTFMMFRLR